MATELEQLQTRVEAFQSRVTQMEQTQAARADARKALADEHIQELELFDAATADADKRLNDARSDLNLVKSVADKIQTAIDAAVAKDRIEREPKQPIEPTVE